MQPWSKLAEMNQSDQRGGLTGAKANDRYTDPAQASAEFKGHDGLSGALGASLTGWIGRELRPRLRGVPPACIDLVS